MNFGPYELLIILACIIVTAIAVTIGVIVWVARR